ncbi:MAG TPA: helical backbone metal receptor [Usitatibacter sp.]|nr:helical backbone metal receptor [Usitatibacter sp.]
MAPFLTELVYSANAGSKLVGVSAHSDYPPEAKKLPQVASAVALSMEPLIALAPDLVLAWRDTIRSDDLARLEALHVPVYVAQARRLDDVPRLLRVVATLAGTDAQSREASYRARLEAARRAYAARRNVSVLLEIWHQPLTTIAGAHWMNEALELCGARNAFADLPGVAPVVPWEAVFARDPFAIVGAGSATTESEFRAQWEARPALSAVRTHRLVHVDPDLIQRPTLRLAEGVERLCRGIDRVR